LEIDPFPGSTIPLKAVVLGLRLKAKIVGLDGLGIQGFGLRAQCPCDLLYGLVIIAMF